MRVISLSDLMIPEDRQRKQFTEKALADLRESILDKGLLHAPVVELVDGEYTLVAGERRTRAVVSISDLDLPFTYDGRIIEPGFIPVTLISDLSRLKVREAELEENIIREPLTWQEEAAAIAELHQIRQAQAAEKGETQTAKATATEVLGLDRPAQGSEIAKVTEAMILSKHLDDPDVLSAKSQKEALKVVRKKAEAAHREKLAEQFKEVKSDHTVIHGDSLTLAPTLPDKTYDLVLTDPPYGVGADKFGDQAGTGHNYVDDWEYAVKCYTMVAVEGFRVTKDQATAYVFLDIRNFDEISTIFALAGWDVWDRPLIWSKANGMLPKPEYGPRLTYEAILFATKGKARFHKTGAPDVLTFPLREEQIHGAQKPVELYHELLTRSAMPGAKVVDFFAGSGTIFPAATKAKAIAIGIELVKANHDMCASRLMKDMAQINLEEFA